MTDLRVAWLGAEVLVEGQPALRTAMLQAEVLLEGHPALRTAMLQAEVLTREPRPLLVCDNDKFEKPLLGTTDLGYVWQNINHPDETSWAIDTVNKQLYAPDVLYDGGATAGTILVAEYDTYDCVIEVDMPVVNDYNGVYGFSPGIAYRMFGPNRGFQIVANTLLQNFGAGWGNTGLFFSPSVSGDHWKIVLDGPTHTLIRNGSLIGTYTQTGNQYNTQHGLSSGDIAGLSRFDNWHICPLTVTKPWTIGAISI